MNRADSDYSWLIQQLTFKVMETKNESADAKQLLNTVRALLVAPKGLLALDESNLTSNKRFAQYGIPQTADARRRYREMLLKTPGLSQYISGAILHDETVRQQTSGRISFIDVLKNAGIIPGIKVDAGTTALAGFGEEKITEGLDGLRDRLGEYATFGLLFAKWRAVIMIGDGMPTEACISSNVQSLARYAALCQEAGMVPIVEPEVLMDGAHSLDQCFNATERVLHALFEALYKQGVIQESLILKPNMVLPGTTSETQNSDAEIADATIKCFTRCVPAAVPGIAFLSGGQSGESASARLNEMHRRYKNRLPWALTFSFSRALQLPALEIWRGQDEHTQAAQDALLIRAKCNSDARRGEYDVVAEKVNSTTINQ